MDNCIPLGMQNHQTKRFLVFFFLLLLWSQAGCENLFNNENNAEALSATIQADAFIIKNNLPFDVYFFAVDLETSYVIDWIPIESEENKVMAGRVRTFSTDVILSFEKGRPAIVYFWSGNDYGNTLEIDQNPEL
jgi:hypothetical protein